MLYYKNLRIIQCCYIYHSKLSFGTSAKVAVQFNSVNIFDRQAKKLQKERAAQRKDVNLYDYIKEEVGYRLSDRVFDVKKEFKHALDLGCGRGYAAKHLTSEWIKKLTLTDISESALKQADTASGIEVNRQVLDEENLELSESSIDLVLSNLSLHWVNNVPRLFKVINDALVPDGVFMASFFGGETLYELRSSLQLAEQERCGGLSPHISPFMQIRDVGGLLNSTGYTMLTIDTDEIVVNYPTMFELLEDLKGMGESNAAFNRPLHLHRDVLMTAAAIYRDMYSTNQGVHSTFQIIYLVGWKPHESQPKPVARGSQNISFKDIGKVKEGHLKVDE